MDVERLVGVDTAELCFRGCESAQRDDRCWRSGRRCGAASNPDGRRDQQWQGDDCGARAIEDYRPAGVAIDWSLRTAI